MLSIAEDAAAWNREFPLHFACCSTAASDSGDLALGSTQELLRKAASGLLAIGLIVQRSPSTAEVTSPLPLLWLL
jgi:hypothetical protein